MKSVDVYDYEPNKFPNRVTFGGLEGLFIIHYNGFPRGINVINKKKKNKITPIINIKGFYIGLLTLPSNVVYPQSYNRHTPKKGSNYKGILFVTMEPNH